MLRPVVRIVLLVAVLLILGRPAAGDELPLVKGVEAQPLKAQVQRVADALDFLGEPLTASQKESLAAAVKETDGVKAGEAIQKILDPLTLAGVNINPESRVKVVRGGAVAKLNEQGWRVFLVKVHNEAGVTAKLRASSPNAEPVYKRSSSSPAPKPSVKPEDVPGRWLDVQTFDQQPLVANLSGVGLEYRIMQIYSRDRGKREGKFAFDVGQGTQDLGFRNELPVLFECEPAVSVTLEVLDTDGQPTTGQFVIKDSRGQVYPARSRRLAPDFFFHDQIYRHSGEVVLLPPGQYDVTFTRGPEYRVLHRTITVPRQAAHKESFQLQRWIKLTDHRWYSGDHHVHAAGCAHYEAPTEGVGPHDMMRHILGEDLNVGCVLSWGPCWYAQKQFFGGEVHKLSTPDYLMRYDVEVSGFPSQHAGHLCLLRLTEDDYTYPAETEFDFSFGEEKGRFKGTRTEKIAEWPSWDLPILQWGKKQGGVVGFSHSGWGLQVSGDTLPNYNMPKFDGIGANEYVVDVVHDACDFISSVDTPIIWELAIWYHTLNCGYTCRISGETDFPCIYGDRVGLGRIYVKLDDKGKGTAAPTSTTNVEKKPAAKDPPARSVTHTTLDYDTWVLGLRDGRSYCGDGLSHLIDFNVNGLGVGEKGANGRTSVLATKAGDKLKITTKVAALLEDKPREDVRSRPLDQKPYWHVERARVGNTNKVPVELIVNGHAVARQEIVADGQLQDVTFDYTPTMSSWVALRIFPTCHTNPVFVEVDQKPIRASRKSAQWCLDAVDVCWKQKEPRIRPEERPTAAAAYDVARKAYAKILGESFNDQ